MKIFFIFICISVMICPYICEDIKQLYFDPETSMTEFNQDGVVVIETGSGIKSTICMDTNSANKNAEVICRMLGYEALKTKLKAVSLISTRKSTFSNGIHFQNINCQGNETNLFQCPGFEYYNKTAFKCQNHNQDLHVYCLGNYRFKKSTLYPPKSNCTSGGFKIASLTNQNHGLLKLRNENQEYTVCGVNRNFGTNEANLFCKELLCEPTANARIIEGYYVPGAPIGGFKNMKCSSNATSLSDCINVYPNDNERCTPSDNIGLICNSNPEIPDPYPEVECTESSLSLIWNKSQHPDIKPEFVSIVQNGNPCRDVTIYDSVKLSVDYTKCGMQKDGNNETIVYTFQAKRLYPKINNKIIIKNDQLYKVSCIISRFDGATQTNYSISSVADQIIIGNHTPIPTTMIISSNNKFQPILYNIKGVNIGSEIFVKVSLQQSKSYLVPFLDRCVIESGHLSEPLILNKCPAIPDLVISPLDSVTIMFSFKSFTIGNINDPAIIKCTTSLCGRNSVGCIPTCQKTS